MTQPEEMRAHDGDDGDTGYEEAAEGIDAFLGKRAAVWRGH